MGGASWSPLNRAVHVYECVSIQTAVEWGLNLRAAAAQPMFPPGPVTVSRLLRKLLPVSGDGGGALLLRLQRAGRPVWAREDHQTAALPGGLQVNRSGRSSSSGGSAHPQVSLSGVPRCPPSCHHPSREPHRCHPGPCPPCRQLCLMPLPGCSHTCPQPCHDLVLVRCQQVGSVSVLVLGSAVGP